MGVLIAAWLSSGRISESIRKVWGDRVLLLLVIFYLYHAVSVLYSSNLSYAAFDLQVKLSFLLFPFLLSAFSFSPYNAKRFRLFFIAGAFATAIWCLIHAVLNFYQTHDKGSFFYEQFAGPFHPAYLSIYLNLAFLFLMEEYFVYSEGIGLFKKFQLFAMIILFAAITLLSARTASTTSIITILLYFSILFFQKKISGGNKLIAAALIACVLLIQLMAVNFYNRFSQIEDVLQTPSPSIQVDKNAYESSTMARIHLWQNSFEVIKQHPLFGVGIGDVKDELVIAYQKNHYERGAENHTNPHNQYLQTAVALGIAGLVILLLILILPLFSSFKNKDWIYCLFILIIALNALTESILERESGIIFFSFFAVFFRLQSKLEHNADN